MLLSRLAVLLSILTCVIAVTTEKQALINLYDATHVCMPGGVAVLL